LCRSGKNPYPPHGTSSEIPRGRGVLRAKTLEAKYEAKLEFLVGRGCKTKTNRGGRGRSMDSFWTYTLLFKTSLFIRIVHQLPALVKQTALPDP